MPKAKLVAEHLGPDGVLIVPALLDYGLAEDVRSGDVIEGPAELIGEGPRWRQITGEDDPMHPAGDPSGFFERREHAGHQEVYDLGSGLLSQVGTWEPVKASTPATSTPEN